MLKHFRLYSYQLRLSLFFKSLKIDKNSFWVSSLYLLISIEVLFCICVICWAVGILISASINIGKITNEETKKIFQILISILLYSTIKKSFHQSINAKRINKKTILYLPKLQEYIRLLTWYPSKPSSHTLHNDSELFF